MDFIITKTKDYRFNHKVETFKVSGNESDCFDLITQDIGKEKVEWSNITDETRNYEVKSSGTEVELKVHQDGRISSNVVCTIKYEIGSI
jgi:hypothetical protein